MGDQTAQPWTELVAAGALQVCLQPECVPDWLHSLQAAAAQAAAVWEVVPCPQWVGPAAAFGPPGPASAGLGWRRTMGAHPGC